MKLTCEHGSTNFLLSLEEEWRNTTPRQATPRYEPQTRTRHDATPQNPKRHNTWRKKTSRHHHRNKKLLCLKTHHETTRSTKRMTRNEVSHEERPTMTRNASVIYVDVFTTSLQHSNLTRRNIKPTSKFTRVFKTL